MTDLGATTQPWLHTAAFVGQAWLLFLLKNVSIFTSVTKIITFPIPKVSLVWPA